MQNRRIMGIGRIELAKKKIDFHPIGPARGLGFAVAPDRKRGYGLLRDIGEYEFWTFDLRELPRASRARRSAAGRAWRMRVSSNGNVHLHPHRPATRSTCTTPRRSSCLRTITLDGDMTGVHARAAARSRHCGPDA